MILHLALLACWVAMIVRLYSTFVIGPRPVWRTAFAITLIVVTLCATARYEPWLLDSFTPNLAEAVSYACLILGAGTVNVYLDALHQPDPSWTHSYRHIIWAGCVAALLVSAWLCLPEAHQREVRPTIALLPMTTPLAIFILAAYVPMVPTMFRIARYCISRLKGSTPREPGESSGLVLIGCGAVVAAVSFIWTLTNTLFRLKTGAPESMDSVQIRWLSPVNALSLASIAIGATTLAVMPARSRRRQEADFEGTLDPLWHTLTARYPSVRLTSSESVTRKLIETHDALAQFTVHASRVSGASPQDVAVALYRGSDSHMHGEASMSASRALELRHPDEDPIPLLARHFRKLIEEGGEPCTQNDGVASLT